ncbi:MAG: DM13 domain-containing protein [Chloroflexota bacterium]|nr:DM13 domain-containing protein [Chloroflexota bacterium]
MGQLINLAKRILTWLWTTRNGRITLAGMIAAAIPLLLLVGWLIRPLFVDTVVDEAFPLGADATIPEELTEDEATVMMSAASKLEIEVQESMTDAMSAATVLKAGAFVDGDAFHQGEGAATIYQLEDGSHVLRFEDFRVTNGPALFVLVSPHADPQGRGDISDAGYTELARLKGNVGNQNYILPADLSPEDINSVIIYCKPFRVVFSTAPLTTN